ncbi:splicing factor YJU2-like [Antedon mediterranea]|uniref:splicing factor YJU2-like n=1 Tax=Antedon mediterranea TaxID=105859 RepID=UPI003AF9FF93
MSERKVLNKYYPPDFDPSKIPKVKAEKNKKFVVRLMAPCHMRCKTCGEYIYQGKKFNARKEDVLDMNYLGLRMYRFYIKCPKCVAEISFRTDPESQDYVVEAGATRNFEAVKLLDEEEKRIKKQREDEEANNPMKVLENRTKDSKQEMDIMENIEELRELNTRQADVDHIGIIKEKEEEMRKRQEEEDEAEIRKIFGKSSEIIMKRLDDSGSEEDEEKPLFQTKLTKGKRPTDFIHEDVEAVSSQKKQKVWDRSVGQLKSSLSSLVKTKKAPKHKDSVTPIIKTKRNLSETSLINDEEKVVETKAVEGSSRTVEPSSVNSNQNTVQPSSVTGKQNTVDASSANSKQNTVDPSSSGDVESDLTIGQQSTEETSGISSLPVMAHIKEGMVKKKELKVKSCGLGLDLLGGYSDSDDSNSDVSE